MSASLRSLLLTWAVTLALVGVLVAMLVHDPGELQPRRSAVMDLDEPAPLQGPATGH